MSRRQMRRLLREELGLPPGEGTGEGDSASAPAFSSGATRRRGFFRAKDMQLMRGSDPEAEEQPPDKEEEDQDDDGEEEEEASENNGEDDDDNDHDNDNGSSDEKVDDQHDEGCEEAQFVEGDGEAEMQKSEHSLEGKHRTAAPEGMRSRGSGSSNKGPPLPDSGLGIVRRKEGRGRPKQHHPAGEKRKGGGALAGSKHESDSSEDDLGCPRCLQCTLDYVLAASVQSIDPNGEMRRIFGRGVVEHSERDSS
eukprot:RCo048727